MRLSIDVRQTGATGYELAAAVREEAGIQLELASANVVVAVFGMGEEATRTGARLASALGDAVSALEGDARRLQHHLAPPPPWGDLAMTPREAFLGPQEAVPLGEATGRIAAESLAAYPPGIPNVLPGERLTEETLAYVVQSVAHGGFVRGSSDRALRTVRVAR
jgi:lysine decarboxylase